MKNVGWSPHRRWWKRPSRYMVAKQVKEAASWNDSLMDKTNPDWRLCPHEITERRIFLMMVLAGEVLPPYLMRIFFQRFLLQKEFEEIHTRGKLGSKALFNRACLLLIKKGGRHGDI